MTRLAKLVKIVEQEQSVVRNGGTAEDRESLARCQKRLFDHVVRTGKTVPFQLLAMPEATCQKN